MIFVGGKLDGKQIDVGKSHVYECADVPNPEQFSALQAARIKVEKLRYRRVELGFHIMVPEDWTDEEALEIVGQRVLGEGDG